MLSIRHLILIIFLFMNFQSNFSLVDLYFLKTMTIGLINRSSLHFLSFFDNSLGLYSKKFVLD